MNRLSRNLMSLGIIVLGTGVALGATGKHPRMSNQAEPPAIDSLACECPQLYVDATNGADSELCGPEPGSPCKTIQTAIDRIPQFIHRDITVHVAAGTYSGGILIVGRTSPNGSRIRVIGEPDGTIVTGPEGEATGVSIIQSSNVVLENLDIRGFVAEGIRTILSTGGVMQSVTLSDNGDGLFLGESDTVIMGSLFRNNMRTGVTCEGGWLTFHGNDNTLFAGNAAAGIQVVGCHASVESPIAITGGAHGLLAEHGGEINLNSRTDVGVYPDVGGTALMADCHGMIVAFGNTCVGDCGCTALRYGVCAAGAAPGGGRRRSAPVYKPL